MELAVAFSWTPPRGVPYRIEEGVAQVRVGVSFVSTTVTTSTPPSKPTITALEATTQLPFIIDTSSRTRLWK